MELGRHPRLKISGGVCTRAGSIPAPATNKNYAKKEIYKQPKKDDQANGEI